MPAPATLRRNHDFTVLWAGQTLSELGNQMSLFAFPLVTFALTGSTLLAGLVGAAHLLGLVAALLPAGVLSDRVDRRRLLRATSALGVLLHASLVVAALTSGITLVHLVLVALLSGVAAGVFAPTEISALRSVVSREQLPTAFSHHQARQHIASLAGGPLGALLYGVTRWLPFAADAASYAVAWVLLGRLRTDLSAPAGPRRSPLVELREGAVHVWRHPLFRVVAGWACLSNLAMNTLFSVAVLRMVSEGVDPLGIGLVDTAAGAAGIVGALLAPRLIERLPTGWLSIAVAWSPLPMAVPLAVWGHPAVVAAALGVVLLLNPAGNAGMAAYRVAVTPPELVGRTQSTMQFVAMLLMPLAPVLAGALLTAVGGTTAVLLAGGLCGLAALVPTLSRPVRAMPRPAHWPAPPARVVAPAG